MAVNKKNWLVAIECFTPADQMVLLKSAILYEEEELLPVDLPFHLQGSFNFMKLDIDQYKKKYQAVVEKNRANGKKGGNPNFKKGKSNPYYKKEDLPPLEDASEISFPCIIPLPTGGEYDAQTAENSVITEYPQPTDNQLSEITQDNPYNIIESNSIITSNNRITKKEIYKEKKADGVIHESGNGKAVPKRRKAVALDLSFVSEEFLPIMNEWIEYKANRGQRYKTQIAIVKCYEKLLKDSNHNTELARRLVDKSIGSNYSGICEYIGQMPSVKSFSSASSNIPLGIVMRKSASEFQKEDLSLWGQ